MTKEELKAYAGLRFWNVSRRPGGKFRDIDCLTIYEITKNGTCKYISEYIGCVANRAQKSLCETITGGIYHRGRPYAGTLTAEFLEKVKAEATE